MEQFYVKEVKKRQYGGLWRILTLALSFQRPHSTHPPLSVLISISQLIIKLDFLRDEKSSGLPTLKFVF